MTYNIKSSNNKYIIINKKGIRDEKKNLKSYSSTTYD